MSDKISLKAQLQINLMDAVNLDSGCHQTLEFFHHNQEKMLFFERKKKRAKSFDLKRFYFLRASIYKTNIQFSVKPKIYSGEKKREKNSSLPFFVIESTKI